MTLPRVHVRIPPALIDADISDGAFRLAVLLGSVSYTHLTLPTN